MFLRRSTGTNFQRIGGERKTLLSYLKMKSELKILFVSITKLNTTDYFNEEEKQN